MTNEELETIICKHEMQQLELKESFSAECIETACAFANFQGGFIIIGVDNKGNPAKQQLRFEGLRDYENKIATATEPSISVDAETLEFRGRRVVVLKVVENPLKPVAYKGRCYIRKGSVNHQMTPAEIAECHLKSTGGSMDSIFIPGATKADLSMEAVRKYMRRSVAKGRRAYSESDDPWEILLKLEWVKSETEITRAAYLLFANDVQRKFSQAIVHSGAFRADGALIVDSRDSKGNIQDQIDDAMAFIQKNIRCALVITPGKVDHDPVWDYPLEAIRETLANAICHRDYGAVHDIQVKIVEDYLRISSPGQLPFDMPMEFLMNPAHSSKPRNKIIAQAFFDMGIIERYGSGIKRIKASCDENGNPYPEWNNMFGEFVTTYKPRAIRSGQLVVNGEDGLDQLRRSLHAGLRKMNEGISDGIIDGINDGIIKMVEAVYQVIKESPGINVPRLEVLFRKSKPTIERAIAILKEAKRIEHRGSKKTGGYFSVS